MLQPTIVKSWIEELVSDVDQDGKIKAFFWSEYRSCTAVRQTGCHGAFWLCPETLGKAGETKTSRLSRYYCILRAAVLTAEEYDGRPYIYICPFALLFYTQDKAPKLRFSAVTELLKHVHKNTSIKLMQK